jgi:hypothetical protein
MLYLNCLGLDLVVPWDLNNLVQFSYGSQLMIYHLQWGPCKRVGVITIASRIGSILIIHKTLFF